MSKKDPISGDMNEKINFPQVNTGLSKTGGGGRVNTSWGFINWTPKKLLFASIALGVPYAIAIIASFVTGIYLITTILISVGILVALLVQITRWLDRSDDF